MARLALPPCGCFHRGSNGLAELQQGGYKSQLQAPECWGFGAVLRRFQEIPCL